jgi:hypothetical protein
MHVINVKNFKSGNPTIVKTRRGRVSLTTVDREAKMNILRIIASFILVVLGVILIKFGDRDVTRGSNQGGIITKVFSGAYLNPELVKWQRTVNKWVFGIVVIWFSFWLMFDFRCSTCIKSQFSRIDLDVATNFCNNFLDLYGPRNVRDCAGGAG